MTAHLPLLDLDHLHELVGDDRSLRDMLFKEFIASAQVALTQLNESLDANNNSKWREAAHGFKGICYNLGALELGKLCHEAQLDYEQPQAVKSDLFSRIECGFLDLEAQLINEIQ